MKRVLIPKDQDQLNSWIDQLREADRPYTMVSKNGKVAIEVDANDAEQILGIEPEKKRLPKWLRITAYVIIGLTALAILAPDGEGDTNQNNEEIQLDSAALRRQQIESQFSAWDGSHNNLTRAIKASMNDPKSYDHVMTTFWDKGDYLLVKTSFRGKNAFGGVVMSTITARVDLQGNVIEVVSQE